MKGSHFLQQLIVQLKSPDWTVQALALEQLNSIYHLQDIQTLVQISIKNKDDSLKRIVINKIEDLTHYIEEVEYLSSLIKDLCLYLTDHHSSTSKEAKQTLDQFFNNSNIHQFLKLEVIKTNWKKADDETRYYLIKIIGEKKFFPLAILVLEALQSENDKLVDLAILSLKSLNDRRGPRYLNKLLLTSPALEETSRWSWLFNRRSFLLGNVTFKKASEKQVLNAILAIGEIGDIIDSLKLIPFLFCNQPMLAEASLWSISQLAKQYALPLFYLAYQKSLHLPKNAVINIIGKIEHPWSARLLIKLKDETNNPSIHKNILLAFEELRPISKYKVLIKGFLNSNRVQDPWYVVALCQCNNANFYPYLMQFLNREFPQDPVVLRACLNALKIFNRSETYPLLVKNLEQSEEINEHIFSCLLHHRSFSIENLINSNIFNDQKLKQIKLLIFKLLPLLHHTPFHKENEQFIIQFLENELIEKNYFSDEDWDIYSQAISLYPSPKTITTIFKHFTKAMTQDNLKENNYKAIVGMIVQLTKFKLNLFVYFHPFLSLHLIQRFLPQDYCEEYVVSHFVNHVPLISLDEYKNFILRFNLSFKSYIDKSLPTISEQTVIMKCIYILSTVQSEMTEGQEYIQFNKFLTDFYQRSSDTETKIEILKILLETNKKDAYSFVIKEYFKNQEFKKYLRPLIQERARVEI